MLNLFQSIIASCADLIKHLRILEIKTKHGSGLLPSTWDEATQHQTTKLQLGRIVFVSKSWGAPTLDVGDLYFDQNFHLVWLGCIYTIDYSAVLIAYDDGTKGAFSYRLVWSLLQWLGIGDWVSAVIGACLAGSWMW